MQKLLVVGVVLTQISMAHAQTFGLFICNAPGSPPGACRLEPNGLFAALYDCEKSRSELSAILMNELKRDIAKMPKAEQEKYANVQPPTYAKCAKRLPSWEFQD